MKLKFSALLLLLFVAHNLTAQVRLPELIGDGMVLQRNSDATLWGWSDANKKITVTTSWSKEKFTTLSDEQGRWFIDIPTGEAKWAQSITISDGKKATLNNVMVGEVWICTGQSNMAMPIMGLSNQQMEGAMEVLSTANNYPNIKLFRVRMADADEPIEEFSSYGGWQDATSENIAPFSALANQFARTLTDFMGRDIPIALIQNTWVGTRIEAWMSKESIDNIEGIDQEYTYDIERTRRHRSRLYNAMIHPTRHYTAKGFLWYQGESNWLKPEDYHLLMESMVKLWRKDWGDDTMPFYFVQLAPYKLHGSADGINIPLTVEAQVKALDLIPYSGMVGTTDIGHATNIHPPCKKQIGERMAYIALRNDYGFKAIPEDAPRFKEMTISEGTALLSFHNTTRQGSNNSFKKHDNYQLFEIKGFEMAGEDRVFYPAEAKIEASQISVTCDKVANPVAVRYAFYNLCEGNVVTVLGQPLIPFRTDNW
ncbi:MAG: sialate O-acetylesterase [Rikenellaceae bacterium]